MEQMTLAYLGPEGTYSHEAAETLINEHTTYPAFQTPQSTYSLIPFPELSGIIEAVADNKVMFGLVPAENSIEGAVNLTLDSLANFDLYIQCEIILNITHHLLSFMTELGEIHTVMSHYQALAQCRHFIKTKLPHATILPKESTAEAVRLLVEQKQTGTAAIGSFASHLRYQAPIKWTNIGDFRHNQTSFLLIGKKAFALFPETKKTTFVVFPKGNQPGELYKILRVFAKYQINLCKIVSRPNKIQLGSYLFWLDCELGPTHPAFSAILNDLRKEACCYKNLGSYPVYYSLK